MKLKELIGSGDKIILFTLPFLIPGIILNIIFTEIFSVGGPPEALQIISIIITLAGIIIWLWSVYLILTVASKDKLITYGPFALVKHPIYTGISFLVLPWLGFLLDSWLGIVIGLCMYWGSRKYAPEEEKNLSRIFGRRWEEYSSNVMLPWL